VSLLIPAYPRSPGQRAVKQLLSTEPRAKNGRSGQILDSWQASQKAVVDGECTVGRWSACIHSVTLSSLKPKL